MSNAAWRKKDKPEWTVYSFLAPNINFLLAGSGAEKRAKLTVTNFGPVRTSHVVFSGGINTDGKKLGEGSVPEKQKEKTKPIYNFLLF